MRIETTPLLDGPILPIRSNGAPPPAHRNINGPSLLRVPDWLANPLGRYYLYYADHKGDRIKLAYADALAGPWTEYEPGALQLAQTPYLQAPPTIPEGVDREALARPRGDGVPSVLDDCTIPHIASPDVVVDESTRTLRLYHHGLVSFPHQLTRVAVSRDGLSFEARDEILSPPYLRVFRYGAYWYGLAMPGGIFRSEDGLGGFEAGPVLFEPNMRHAGVWLRGDTLWVFWTRVGDAPERILLSKIDLRGDWQQWRSEDELEVRRPVEAWEGAAEPIGPSLRSAVDHPVNQLRDPYFFEDTGGGKDEGARYLVYAVAGESGIAICRLDVD